jgi:hypothetical protein
MFWTVLVVSPRACRCLFESGDLAGLGGFDEEEATLDDVDQLCKICRWSSISNCACCSFSDVILLEWGSCQRSSLADVWIGWKKLVVVMFRRVVSLFEMYMVGYVLWDGLLLRSEIASWWLCFQIVRWENVRDFCIACEGHGSFG